MPRVFLSVGSNMGDRVECMREAVARLRALAGTVFVDASPLYQTIRELVAALDDEHEVRPSDLPRRWFER